MSVPVPCPVCHGEVAYTNAKVRKHVADRHPEHQWTRRDSLKLIAARHAVHLLGRLDLLTEERFTWLYKAVVREHDRREAEMPADAPWNPWTELRRREWVDLEWAYLSSGRGRIEDAGGGRRLITLDARLTRDERAFTLAHELVHEERGGGVDVEGMPPWCVMADEHTCDAIAARRLGVDVPERPSW